MRKLLLSIMLLIPLSACFIVGNFGIYWDQGIIDPAIEGKWVSTEDTRKVFHLVKEDDHYRYSNEEGNTAIKTLLINEEKFLMMKDEKGTENLLIRYLIKDGVFNLYQLNHSAIKHDKEFAQKRAQDVENGKIKEKRFDKLTEQDIEAIKTYLEHDNFWSIMIKLTQQSPPVEEK